MTVWDVLQAVRKRWFLALAGLIATAAGTYAAGAAPGVYYQQVHVVFLAPNLGHEVNAYQLPAPVGAAGLVGRQVSTRPQGPVPVTTRVTIVDLGIRDGALARVPSSSSNSQWTHSFDGPMLDVEIVGDSPERVRAGMTLAVSEIRRTLRQGQLALGVRPDALISTALNPPTPPVYHYRGSSSRARAASFALGVGLTLTLVVLFDRRRGGTRGRAHRLVRLAMTGRRLAAWSSVDAQHQGASLLRLAMHPPGPPLADRTRLFGRPLSGVRRRRRQLSTGQDHGRDHRTVEGMHEAP
jgi:hypothetical protein